MMVVATRNSMQWRADFCDEDLRIYPPTVSVRDKEEIWFKQKVLLPRQSYA